MANLWVRNYRFRKCQTCSRRRRKRKLGFWNNVFSSTQFRIFYVSEASRKKETFHLSDKTLALNAVWKSSSASTFISPLCFRTRDLGKKYVDFGKVFDLEVGIIGKKVWLQKWWRKKFEILPFEWKKKMASLLGRKQNSIQLLMKVCVSPDFCRFKNSGYADIV